MRHNLNSLFIKFVIVLAGATVSFASPIRNPQSSIRNDPMGPADTVRTFYAALRNRQYVGGFALSVYKPAIIGLSREDLKDLESDFEATFSQIPAVLDIKGEQATGDSATVFIQSPGQKALDPISLVRIDDEWRVGDLETYRLVQQQGRDFFFNVRMLVNEREVYARMNTIIGSELTHASEHHGAAASLDDLIKMGALPASIRNEGLSGYRWDLKVTSDGASFITTAVPMKYGKSGRLSFYADTSGVHAEDNSGQIASASSPYYLTGNNR